MRDLYSFVRLGRPLFLVGGVVFHALGAAAAHFEGFPLNVTALIVGQVVITASQLMTHYSNDYFDLEADRANLSPTKWSGGSRVLPDGLLPPRVALLAAILLGALAVTAIGVIGFVIQPSIWSLLVPLLALFLAWSYSGPPLRLHSRGAGELATALIVPVLTPLTGYTFQAGEPGWLPLLAAVPLACLQICMIISVNLPDADGDRIVKKRTLVVWLGRRKAGRIYILVLALAYLSLPVLVRLGLPALAVAGVMIPLPLAGWLALRMVRGAWGKPGEWNSMAFWTIGLLVSSGALAAAALTWLALT